VCVSWSCTGIAHLILNVSRINIKWQALYRSFFGYNFCNTEILFAFVKRKPSLKWVGRWQRTLCRCWLSGKQCNEVAVDVDAIFLHFTSCAALFAECMDYSVSFKPLVREWTGYTLCELNKLSVQRERAIFERCRCKDRDKLAVVFQRWMPPESDPIWWWSVRSAAVGWAVRSGLRDVYTNASVMRLCVVDATRRGRQRT